MEVLPLIAAGIATMAVVVSPVKIPTACPPTDPVDAVHIAHESDCSKFYKCFMGDKYEKNCPVNSAGYRLYFNRELQVCDWRWNVTCRNELDPECAAVDDGCVWPYPHNCKSYYFCDDGKKRARDCKDGLLFDPVRLSCRPANDVICAKLTDQCPPADSDEIVLLPHENNCSYYYACTDGKKVLKRCSSDQLFDSKRRRCVPADEASCNTDPGSTPTPEAKCPPTGAAQLPHETRCDLFYSCANGAKQLRECKYGLYFDAVKGMCTWWENVDCGSRSTTPISSTMDPKTETTDRSPVTECPFKDSDEPVLLPHECLCEVYYLCRNGEQIRRTCPSGEVFDHVNQVCRDSREIRCVRPNQCPEHGKVKIPDENDCNRYYQCMNGEKTPKKCLDGHYFNEFLQTCDRKSNTNCYV
ncbi:peritrophin-48-like [Colletes gigas]|uniref:peritrophin-48-like n=1 Tax=Colletes gigas TaxID=935657 RepID=UPI001C9B94EC|nr:peritrophin-48-like [Colletes gigas]